MSPRVSVLMTIYNGGRYLAPAIDSLLAQTFPDFELVAVENGSTDGSKARVQAYAAADARVRVVDLADNIGRTPALNVAVDEARGELLAVLDADDIAAPMRFARQVALLDARPEVVAVASHVRFIDEESELISVFEPGTDTDWLRQSLAWSNVFSHSSVMMRRRAVFDAGGYPRQYVFAQDLALVIALAKLGDLAMIAEPLADIREHRTRATNRPVYQQVQLREMIALHGSVLAGGGLSADACRRGRNRITDLGLSLAKRQLRAREPLAAAAQVVRAALNAPGHFMRRMLPGGTT